MDHSVRRGYKYLAGMLISILVVILMLSACSGPTGAQGVQGSSGPAGPSGPPGKDAINAEASIHIVPFSSPAGKAINVMGAGFTANEDVWLEIHGNFDGGLKGSQWIAISGRTQVNEYGAFDIADFVPKATLPGVYTLRATSSDGIAATAAIVVTE